MNNIIDRIKLRSSISLVNNTIHHLRALEKMVEDFFEIYNQITAINAQA